MPSRGLLDELQHAAPVGRMDGSRRRGDQPDGVFPRGRRCADHEDWGCITILSIYNPGPWCFCCARFHAEEIAEAVELAEERLAA